MSRAIRIGIKQEVVDLCNCISFDMSTFLQFPERIARSFAAQHFMTTPSVLTALGHMRTLYDSKGSVGLCAYRDMLIEEIEEETNAPAEP